MFSVTVTNKLETQQLTHNRGPLEFGRGPSRDGTLRVVVRDAFVSRDHLRLEPVPGGKVRIVNLSTKAPVMIDNHSLLNPGADCTYPLPVRLGVGETVIDLDPDEPEVIAGSALYTVPAPLRGDEKTRPDLLALGEGIAAEDVVGWLETVVGIQRASSPQEFFQQTADALVERIGLDSGLVILREGDNWRVVGGQSRLDRPAGRAFSQTILNKVAADRRTFYLPAMPAEGGGESLTGVQGVVVSPVFNVKDEVIGVVYGTRTQRTKVREIGKLEAQVVQLLAAAVGAGLARLEQDAEAHRLRVARDAAEEADRAKSGFLAMVSHELRTPLTTIIGYSEMLIEQATADNHPQYTDDLKVVHTAAGHLLALINDILDFSKIEAGKLEVAKEQYAPASLIQDLMVTVAPLAKKNNNRLEVDCPADLGRGVGDPTRIRQCVLNLVGNACKFTTNGLVKVAARRYQDASGDWLAVQVTDTGIGMTPEQVARLGRPFEQVDSTAGRKFGGTGLGLAISMKLCAAMGGKIDVRSQLGKGSTFTMVIKAVLS
jgi:signal transduction histidine kinase